MSSGNAVALVFAGAVAKGPFGAGAVARLAAKPLRVRRIAATSSGALTAAVIGAGVATGNLPFAAGLARDLWLDHAAWQDIAHVALGELLHARGVLDTSRVVRIVQDAIAQVVESAPGPDAEPALKVTFVTTSLNALPDPNSELPTYEYPISFYARDFLDEAKWPAIARAAAASATFPGVFAPTAVDGKPCVDGGAVNNTPISYVLDDTDVRTVIVVTTESSAPPPSPAFGGVELAGKIADIVINERVSHDLSVARAINDRLARVEDALRATGATPETRAKVLAALGWRALDLRLVYPDPALEGTSFTGFFERSKRADYIAAGERAAEKAMSVPA